MNNIISNSRNNGWLEVVPSNIEKSEGSIRLGNKLKTIESLQNCANILFMLSLIPTIILLKKYKDKKALVIWIISFVVALSAITYKPLYTGSIWIHSDVRTSEIYAKIIGIIGALIPFIYSCIKLIINVKKDKLNKTSKGEKENVRND